MLPAIRNFCSSWKSQPGFQLQEKNPPKMFSVEKNLFRVTIFRKQNGGWTQLCKKSKINCRKKMANKVFCQRRTKKKKTFVLLRHARQYECYWEWDSSNSYFDLNLPIEANLFSRSGAIKIYIFTQSFADGASYFRSKCCERKRKCVFFKKATRSEERLEHFFRNVGPIQYKIGDCIKKIDVRSWDSILLAYVIWRKN